MIPTPLQVVLCWRAPEGPTGAGSPPPFIEASYRAFVGRASSVEDAGSPAEIPNWITGAELKPVEIRRFATRPAIPAAELLDAALHTVVVAWVDEAMLEKGPEYVQWIGEIWNVVRASGKRHGLLVGTSDERLRSGLIREATARGFASLANCQMRTWESLGELAARPATVALSALEKARQALTQGLGRPKGNLQLFISHAKVDGLSLALSLNHAIKVISGLEKFYDAHDIEDGSDWREELQQGVESSVMVAVRTDQYEERPWCVQEVAWADSGGAPVVVVEARSELFHPPSGLGLEGCPWVRIPDGSLTRILYCALRENLRFLLMQRGVNALGPGIANATIVLPRVPTWDSLDGALARLIAVPEGRSYVVYPDPRLPGTTGEALDRFVASRKPGARVVNYSHLMAGDA